MRARQRIALFWQRCTNRMRTQSKENVMKRPKEKNTINRHEEEHQKKVRQPMHHLKRSLLACLLTLMLTTLLTAGVAQAAGLTSATWSIVPSPNGAGSRHNELLGVAAVSSNNIWAVGFSKGSSGITQTLLVL